MTSVALLPSCVCLAAIFIEICCGDGEIVRQRCVIKQHTAFSCQGAELSRANEIDFYSGLKNITSLDLSHNNIRRLLSDDFPRALGGVTHLNLSYNDISFMEKDVFRSLSRLTALDLSRNKLTVISAIDFFGLDAISHVYLSGNPLAQIASALSDFKALVHLDISETPLICDCGLQWLSAVNRRFPRPHHLRKLRLSGLETCFTPISVQGKALDSLDPEDFSCESPIVFPHFAVSFPQSQLTFAGDSLNISCSVTRLQTSATTVAWLRNGALVSHTIVHYTSSDDNGIVTVTAVLQNITEKYEGNWTCQAWSGRGNESQSSTIRLVVLSKSSLECPPITNVTNRGTFLWLRTYAKNVLAELPCPGDTSISATNLCDSRGKWSYMNISACPFTTEFGRVMQVHVTPEAYAGMEDNLELRFGYMKMFLLNQSAERVLVGSDEVNLVVRALEKFVNTGTDRISAALAAGISLVVDWLFDAPFSSLKNGANFGMVPRILTLLRTAARKLDLHMEMSFKNLAITSAVVDADAPEGTYCEITGSPSLKITCLSGGKWRMRFSEDILGTVFIGSGKLPPHQRKRLQIMAFRNVKLFATMVGKRHAPSTLAVGIFLEDGNDRGLEAELAQSLVLDLVVPLLSDLGLPLMFNSSMDISSESCKVSKVFSEGRIARISCTQVGVVMLSQPYDVLFAYHTGTLALKTPVVIYSSAVFTMICNLILVLLFATFFRNLSIITGYKHVLLNIWISFDVLLLMFLSGFNETVDRHLCRAVGIGMQYSTLCVVCWTLNGFFVMYCHTRKGPPGNLIVDPESQEPLAKSRNCVGVLYLFGWLMPVIITVISAALSLNFYGNEKFCYLCLSYSAYAVVLPVAVFGCAALACFMQIFRSKTLPKPLSSTFSGKDQFVFDEITDLRSHAVILLSGFILFLISYAFVWLWASGFQVDRCHRLKTFYELAAGLSIGLCGLFSLFAYWFSRADLPKGQWTVGKIPVSAPSRTVLPVPEVVSSSRTQSPGVAVNYGPGMTVQTVSELQQLMPLNNEGCSRLSSTPGTGSLTHFESPLNVTMESDFVRRISDYNCRDVFRNRVADRPDRSHTVSPCRRGYVSDSSKKETCI